MITMLKTIPRHKLDANAWDVCVATSRQPGVYGYTWYLDAVLPAPGWKWVGVVQVDQTGTYHAVMPVPLRRKMVAGIPYEWVVHQPFFCQFLSVFSADELPDTDSFFRHMVEQFRYGSLYCTNQLPGIDLPFASFQLRTTHVIYLSFGYEVIYSNYTRDRKQNLRRAQRAFELDNRWAIVESSDVEPLLALFRENHAATIDGGVADWAYDMFRNLAQALHKRGLVTLRYAVYNGQIEAGALFICDDRRIIYLFNAASATGRRVNARTILIDQLIQEKAGQKLIFDFESPEKPSIRKFYKSFGAVEEPFQAMRWNRLSKLENLLWTGWRYLNR
ncbi:Acetyltransferase (GNAT) domain-containing protein [Spirosoma fluviale]|uniref:Acetyltransferase (GNAT) domain-containing protein n=2 Tax=Spirosoma fluviale TaxID=1597977 RepID=A0A286GAX2_9BACT|nr:Acetyltransferase (GNAT) domain-containing protein [Spirosoma fluviale]